MAAAKGGFGPTVKKIYLLTLSAMVIISNHLGPSRLYESVFGFDVRLSEKSDKRRSHQMFGPL